MLKTGVKSLLGDRKNTIDPKTIITLVEQIKSVYVKNIQVAIILSRESKGWVINYDRNF